RRVSRALVAGFCLAGVVTLAVATFLLISDTNDRSISARRAHSARAAERAPTSASSLGAQSSDQTASAAAPDTPATGCALTDELRAQIITAIGSSSWVVSDTPIQFGTGGGDPFPPCKIML